VRHRIRKIGAALIALLMLAAASPTSDRLTTGEFDPGDGREYYRQVIRTVLHEGYADDVRLRMLILSTSGENLVGVRERGSVFEVFVLRPNVELFWYETLRALKDGSYDGRAFGLSPADEAAMARDLEARLPGDIRNVGVDRCAAPVRAGLARDLIDAWARVLRLASRSRPSDGRIVMDGASFHFWVRSDDVLSGHVHAPDTKWPSGRLTSVGAGMWKYCRQPSAENQQDIERLLRDVP